MSRTVPAGETGPTLAASGSAASVARPDAWPLTRPAAQTGGGRSIVLVGLMGAGKTTIGRRLAARLGIPFHDADAEIEQAAGITIAELFARYGEAEFRRGEQSVIRRLLGAGPIVLATGGGAFMDAGTRETVRRTALSVWLRCPLDLLVRRTAGRTHRPLLASGSARDILASLIERRHPFYAEADLIVDCTDDGVERTTERVADALASYRPPQRLEVVLPARRYDVVTGPGLLPRAGALLAPILPQKRVVVVTDSTVAPLHLRTLTDGLAETGIGAESIVLDPGEGTKSLAGFGQLTERMLSLGVERRTTVIALGGGVIGDVAGFAAASVMRGLPFVQIPTTLLAQVDSSVGGKTGINMAAGKNLLGAFHQPIAVLADTDTLSTLPLRELRAGYAEIVKAGLIGDPALFDWCEANGAAVLGGTAVRQAEAVRLACAFKARVVGDDEREEKPENGRALLNLGHTFAHALEAEMGFDGALLHGEAVGIGLVLAFRLSARLGMCPGQDVLRVARHLQRTGLKWRLTDCGRKLDPERLVANMARDKKMRDGKLAFVLVRGIGEAFTTADVSAPDVLHVLSADDASLAMPEAAMQGEHSCDAFATASK